MRLLVLSAATLALAACSERPLLGDTSAPVAAAPAAVAEDAPDVSTLPAGTYRIDPSHASLVFTVNHLGFSHYTAQFRAFDATLEIDPANPGAASVNASVDVSSLLLPAPPAGFAEEMQGAGWFNAAAHPQITFQSTAVTMTGPRTATVAGDLTLLGVTKPVTLEARFNGGWEGIPPDPHARIGFSLTGVVKRSEFGMSYGVPTPPSTQGVADDVHVAIEAELIGPPWAGAEARQ